MLLTINEAASRLQVSTALVYQLCARSLLRHQRVGVGRGVIRVPEEALTEYLQSREVCVKDKSPPLMKSGPKKFKHISVKG